MIQSRLWDCQALSAADAGRWAVVSTNMMLDGHNCAESYDHWVRDESEWDRIAAYIEDNPVKAGLVPCAEDYRWSSAGKCDKSAETSLGAAATSGCATTGSPESPDVQD